MRRVITFIIGFILSTGIYAQELGILGAGLSGGVMNYKGDLDDRLSMKFLRPGMGLHFSVLPWPKITLSLNYLHGKIECDDAKAGISKNKYRNLRFYSNIDEISILCTYRIEGKLNSFRVRPNYIPYFFVGFGFFHFNPKAKVNGQEYNLQQVGTEGQHLSNDSNLYPDPYKLWQLSMPFGVGLKRKITPILDVSCEIGLRKTFTDYLDDVSFKYPDKAQLQLEEGDVALYLSDPSNDPKRPDGRKSFAERGHSDKKDWYIYTNITVTYYLTTRAFVSRPTF